MIDKPISEITAEDIYCMVDECEPESNTLDYKEKLPAPKQVPPNIKSKEKIEFAVDVASFANAAGGDIVFGIPDKPGADGSASGLPGTPCGVQVDNVDREINRLQATIRSGIAPQVPGVMIRAVGDFERGPVIIVRVPKSWAGPHMVLNKSPQFYSRAGSEKHGLDVAQIRAAFAQSEAISERIGAFRTVRLGHIMAGETPTLLGPGPTVVLHVLPIGNLMGRQYVDIHAVQKATLDCSLGRHCSNRRYNLDGFVEYDPADDYDPGQYVQFFRDGCLETVMAGYGRDTQVGPKMISGSGVEEAVIRVVVSFLEFHRRISTDPPFSILLSLFGVSGYCIARSGHKGFHDVARRIDRDLLQLPDVLIEDFETPVPGALKPAFDALWQSSGSPWSWSYDDEGNWRQPPR